NESGYSSTQSLPIAPLFAAPSAIVLRSLLVTEIRNFASNAECGLRLAAWMILKVNTPPGRMPIFFTVSNTAVCGFPSPPPPTDQPTVTPGLYSTLPSIICDGGHDHSSVWENVAVAFVNATGSAQPVTASNKKTTQCFMIMVRVVFRETRFRQSA